MVYRRRASKNVDKDVVKPAVVLTQKQHDVYIFLSAGFAQTKIADKLNVKRQTIHKMTQKLLRLGLIKSINPQGNPRFYKSTYLSPVVSPSKKSLHTVLSAPKRTLSKKPIMVKDNQSGKIKHWRRQKLDLEKRDYDTIVSIAGERVRLCRVHGIAYTCTIIHPPAKNVPWKPVKKGMRGLDQYDFKTVVPGIGNVTFRRQKSKQTDELIIWMPEKYFFEWELEEGEKLLEESIWKARKWFQNHFKTYLALAIPYRKPKYAFEIFDPKMKRFVHEKGTIDAVTTGGIAEADESKKDFPEVEFPTIKQARAFVQGPDRLMSAEDRLLRIETSLSKLIDTVDTMAEKQTEFTEQVQEVMGLKKEINRLKERESQEKMYS